MRFAVFILALVVRLAAIEWTGAQRVHFGDGADYIATARSICAQHVYPERGNLPFFRAPGLPFFIAAVTACEPSHVRAIKYGLAMCDALTVLFIFLIAQRLGTRPWIAATLATVHPFFVGAVTDVRGEPLFMMFLVAAILLLLRGNHALSGVALGLAALVRPTGLLCIPLFAWFLWRAGRAPSPRTRGEGGKAALVLLAGALLTLLPWTLRNYARFGEVIVVNDAAGFNLWRGTHPELFKTIDTHDPLKFAKRSLTFETQTVAEAARVVEAKAKTPRARDRQWRRLALENIKRDPSFAATSTLRKLGMYWRPWLHPAEHGWKAISSSVVVNLGLFIFGAIGLRRHPDRRFVIAVLVFFAALWLAHLPYIPTMRLRVPLTDPLLIVFVASAFVTASRRVLAAAVLLVSVLTAVILAAQFGTMSAAREVIAALQAAAGEWWALPLFVALYALCALVLLPVTPLSAAAAVMWGWKVGGTIELITTTLAALPPFFLARRGLSAWVERRLPRETVPKLDTPFLHLLLRIVPIVPYVALNYIAGVMRIRPRDYILATLVGSIPSVFLFAYFIDTMAAGAMGVATQAKIIGVCLLVALAAIIVRVVANRIAARHE